jgi:Family of unknown function (DUF6069)
MSTSTPAPMRATTMHRRRNARLLAVAAAVLAAAAVWLVAELGFGAELRSPAFGAQRSRDVELVNVIVAGAAASLAGWALLAVLERFTARARSAWTVIAVLAMLVWLGGPLSGTGITGANRAWLALMHVVVGAVLIPLLARTSRSRP